MGPPTRIVKAAAGVKKFLSNRLHKVKQIFQRDHVSEEHKTYLVEEDPKHPDKWEHVGNTWIRHHNLPRVQFYTPNETSKGPAADTLLVKRVTEISFADGATQRVEDDWRDSSDDEFAASLAEKMGLWRGTTTFFEKPDRTDSVKQKIPVRGQ